MATPAFILVDGKKMPISNLTITVNGTELIGKAFAPGEVKRWSMPTTEMHFVCDILPDPEDPYGTKWYALLFWLYGVVSYPWLFRN